MDRDIASLRELIEQRFDHLYSRIDDLTAQVTLTNGRLRTAERDVAVLKDRLYVSAGAILLAAFSYIVTLFTK